MRILFFSDHFRPEPTAPAAHVYERCRLWAAAGHQVTVVTSAPNFPEGRLFPGYRNAWRSVELMDGIRVVRVKTLIARNEGFFLRVLDYLSYMVSAFVLAFLEPRPDVVVSSSPHLFVAYAGCAHAAMRRVPHVMEVRDLWPASLLANTGMRPGLIYRLLERSELFLYRHSARVIVLSTGFADDLARRGIPPHKVEVVLNGANLALFFPRSASAEVAVQFDLKGHFVVGYVGTVGLSHGLENAIRAFERLQDTPAVLFVVGVGAAKEGLQQLVATLKITNVRFAPRQLRESVPDFWSVCDVSLIHLKDANAFRTVIPSKIFESMAMGLPILYCGPESPGSVLVQETGAGIWVRPDAPEALAEAVRKLMEDPGLRLRLATAAHATAPEYSRERQANRTLAVLEDAVGIAANRR